jgi:TatD DNase family protein
MKSSTDSPTEPIALVDIGANLAHDSFDADRAEVLERAAQAGVSRIVITGSSRESSHRASELARSAPGRLFSTAGVHPHHAKDWRSSDADWMRALAGRDEVVAVGECGLDYFRNFSPPEDQEIAFRAQLDVAVETGLPVFLHQRDAHDAFCEILADYPTLPPAVAHCFTGEEHELTAYVDKGLYIGITGWICDERRGLHLRELVPLIPPDRLLLETDAPYLLPRDLDPKPSSRRNEPMHLPHIAASVARYLGTSVEELARTTTRNAIDFFGLPEFNK